MRTLADLEPTAAAKLGEYTDPTRRYAFRTYDVVPANRSGSLLPEDILVANLLSLRLSWREVIPLFATGDRPAQDLLAALNHAVGELADAAAYELYDTVEAMQAALEPVAAANRATRSVTGWTPVTVSRVLHRFAPHAVPLVDSRVRGFYGVRVGQEKDLRARLWADVRKNLPWLQPLARGCFTPDGRELTVLRLADILIWTPSKGEEPLSG